MSMTIQQIRQQYPQYKNKSDEELANAMHQKFYAHVPKDEFFNKIGYSPSFGQKTEEEAPSALIRYPMAIAQGMAETGQNLGKFLGTGALRKAFGMQEEEPVNIREALGYKYQPSGLENITEFAASQAPGFMLPEAKLFGAAEKLKSVPKVGEYLSEAASHGVPFASFQATQDESPISGFTKGLGEYAAGLAALKGAKSGIGAIKESKEAILGLPKYAKQLEIANQRNQLAGENITQQLKNLGKTAPAIEQHYANRLENALQLSKDPAKSLAQNLNTAVQNIDEQVSNLYGNVIPKNTPESILAGTKGYKIYQNVADNLVKKFKPVKNVIEKGIETTDEKSLITGLESVDKLQEIPTKDILSYYKTAQQLSNKFNSKAWQEANGLTDAARHEFNDASNYFSGLADKLGEVLSSINPEITTNLEKAKDYFKTYKAPLYERPEYWSAVKKGRITNDILKDTHSEQGGAKLLRGLVLDSPEFTKNALARVLREKPENLKNIGSKEEYEDFVRANPDTSIAYHGLKGLEAGVKKIKGVQPEASFIQKLQSSLAGKELSISNKEIENINSEEAQKVIKFIDNEVEKLNKMKRVKNITEERVKALENKTKLLEEKRAKLIKKFGISALGMKFYKYGKKLLL